MQWAAVCHQHAVWCGRCTHQCFGQPAGILIQLQWAPQSNRLCSAAGRPCSDWQCLCVVHLFIFIRLPDSGEIPAQKVADLLSLCNRRFLVCKLLVAADPHIGIHTLLQLEVPAFSSIPVIYLRGKSVPSMDAAGLLQLALKCVHLLLLPMTMFTVAFQFPLKQQKYLVRCIKHSHLQVDCPEGYTGPVTVGYASPTIQAVNYNVIDSALLVKVTASTATQQ